MTLESENLQPNKEPQLQQQLTEEQLLESRIHLVPQLTKKELGEPIIRITHLSKSILE
jgi:hypothetical protein